MKNKNIVLASASPRRREIMQRAGYEFVIKTADVDESIEHGVPACEAVKILAEKKADAVLNLMPDSVVVGADTVVAVDGKILGKPKDKEDAFKMLRMLSGRTHTVYTGVAVLSSDKRVSFFDETEVEFYSLSDEEIFRYISTGEPMDKAGAYGIQEKGSILVRGINGDFFNVMGLPIARLYRELEEF